MNARKVLNGVLILVLLAAMLPGVNVQASASGGSIGSWQPALKTPINQMITATIASPVYVNADATGANDGTSWANAFTSLQAGLTAAQSGDEIWVASGVYTPTLRSDPAIPRTETFALKPGVALYGGFAGNETARTQRDWVAHLTILSGDSIGDDVNADGNHIAETWNYIVGDNAYHVVTGIGVTETAVLDGFIVTAGNTVGSHGGGMFNYYSNPTLTNITFSGNSAAESGGGMLNQGGSPVLTSITFSGNQANIYGGGMFNYYGNPTLTNITFSSNQAGSGGGMFNQGGSPMLTNATFSGNQAGLGGGMDNYSSNPTLTNATFSGNSASAGGGMYNWYSSSPQIRNTIFWGNTGAQIYNADGSVTIANSNVELPSGVVYSGTGNLNIDPLFVAPISASNAPTTTGNYRLQSGSPVINAGDNVVVTVATDLDGNPRIVNGVVDMGAYEYQGGTTCPCQAQVASTGQTYCTIQEAVDAAQPGDTVKVAGYCAGVQFRDGMAQTVYISKSITLRGGYTTTNWTTANPAANRTTLDAQGLGRAVYITDTISPTVDGFDITNGNATGLGGGWYNADAGGGAYIYEAAATLTHNRIFSNTGGTYGGGVYINYASNVLLNYNDINHNFAGYGGGGIYVLFSTATLRHSIIEQNYAEYGGGVDTTGGIVTVTHILLRSNDSLAAGTIQSWGGNVLYLSNSVIADNHASNGSAGLDIGGGGTAHVTHVTLANNSDANGIGGGIFVKDSGSTLWLTNTIIVSQTVGISVTANNTAYVKGVLWHNNGANTGGTGSITVLNPRSGPPQFVDPASGDYHIQLGSSAIDQGIPTAINDDIDGDPRPQGAAPDLGADELAGVAAQRINIFLEGPYDPATHRMTIDLNSAGYLPLTSPYCQAPRTVAAIPANATDWVLAELRATPDGPARASRSVFVRSDGQVVNDNGSANPEFNAPDGAYYLVIRHRNHLAVMSAAPITLTNHLLADYDFTSGIGQFYGGSDGAVELEPGVWGMFAGDTDGDGKIILALDAAPIQQDNLKEGYYMADTNLNSLVSQAEDIVPVQSNNGTMTAVPDNGAACWTLELSKHVSSPAAQPGDTLTYQLALSATGATTTATLTDTLPVGLTYLPGSVTGGATYTSGQIRYTGPVAPGSDTIITYRAQVNANVPPGSILINTAVVTGAGRLEESSAAVAVPDTASTQTLFLIYSVGDNDFGDATLELLNTAELAAGNSNAVILAVIDGPGTNDSYLYRLQPDINLACPNYSNLTCNGLYVSGQNFWVWPENTGSPYSLAEFLAGAERAYPNAAQVLVRLAGHGDGWTAAIPGVQPSAHGTQPGGFLWDDHPGSSFNTQELSDAFTWAKQATGRPVDLLYLDACLMGAAPVADALRDSVDTLLVSESLEWTESTPIDQDIAAIDGSHTARQLGEHWLRNGAALLTPGDYPHTYSLIDESQMTGVRAAEGNLATALSATLPAGRAQISATWTLAGCFDSSGNGRIGPEDNLCDLSVWAGNIIEQFSDNPTVISAARALQTAVAAAVITETHHNGVFIYSGQPWAWGALGGLSEYLPLRTDNWQRPYYPDGPWHDFLDAYWANVTPPQPPTCTIDCAPPSPPAPAAIQAQAAAGLNNIAVSWSLVGSLPALNGYQLYRNASLMTTTLQSQYIDNAPTLTPGADYCYQIKAVDNTQHVLGVSNIVCAQFGGLTFSIPHIFAAPGSSVLVPVDVSQATGVCIGAMATTILYDQAIAVPTGQVSRTIYTSGYAFRAYTGIPGQIRITTIGNCQPLYGGGSLFWMPFNVSGQAGAVSPLDFIQGLTNTYLYDSSNLQTPVTLTLRDGLLTVQNAYIRGDVNGDGVVNAADALLALHIASGQITPILQQLSACDVNGDGFCTTADSTLILCYAATQDWNLCGLNVPNSLLRANAASEPVELSIRRISGSQGQSVSIPLNIANGSEFAGGEFAFTYNRNLLTFDAATPTTGFILAATTRPGLVRLALASPARINKDGTLATLRFTLNTAVRDESLTFGAVRLNDAAGRDFVTSALQRTLVFKEDTVLMLYLPLVRR